MTTPILTLDSLILARIEPNTAFVNVSVLSEAMIEEPRINGQTLRVVAKKLPRDVVANTIDVASTNLSKLYSRKFLSRTQNLKLNLSPHEAGFLLCSFL